MDIEEMMIDFIMNEADEEQVEEFFGFANHNFTREDCEDNLSQMPDDVFFDLLYSFGFRFIVNNIEWDTDDEDVDLPNEFIMPEGIHEEEDASEYITEQTGFCHKGFNFICQ